MTFDVIAKHNANKQMRPKLTSLTEKRLKHLSNFRFGGFEVMVNEVVCTHLLVVVFSSIGQNLKPFSVRHFLPLFGLLKFIFSFNKM